MIREFELGHLRLKMTNMTKQFEGKTDLSSSDFTQGKSCSYFWGEDMESNFCSRKSFFLYILVVKKFIELHIAKNIAGFYYDKQIERQSEPLFWKRNRQSYLLLD